LESPHKSGGRIIPRRVSVGSWTLDKVHNVTNNWQTSETDPKTKTVQLDSVVRINSIIIFYTMCWVEIFSNDFVVHSV